MSNNSKSGCESTDSHDNRNLKKDTTRQTLNSSGTQTQVVLMPQKQLSLSDQQSDKIVLWTQCLEDNSQGSKKICCETIWTRRRIKKYFQAGQPTGQTTKRKEMNHHNSISKTRQNWTIVV